MIPNPFSKTLSQDFGSEIESTGCECACRSGKHFKQPCFLQRERMSTPWCCNVDFVHRQRVIWDNTVPLRSVHPTIVKSSALHCTCGLEAGCDIWKWQTLRKRWIKADDANLDVAFKTQNTKITFLHCHQSQTELIFSLCHNWTPPISAASFS